MDIFLIYIPISVFVWKEINSADTKHLTLFTFEYHSHHVNHLALVRQFSIFPISTRYIYNPLI